MTDAAAGRKKAAKNGEDGDAIEEAEAAAKAGAGGILEMLADRIGANAGARAVFGDPVETNGRTVIPVAQSMWGSGAGSGESDEVGSSSGGGGGAMTRPLGYIEITEYQTTFVPLYQPWQDVKVILAYAFVILVVSRAINKLLRG